MGIIGKQAARNSVSILLGTIIGAVNTILVLPAAFASFPEGWGLLKVLLAYSMIFAQIFGFGAGNSFIRFSPKYQGRALHSLHSYILLLPLLGMIALALIFIFSGNSLIALVNEKDAYLMEGRLSLLFVLTVIMTLSFTLSGYIGSVMRTIYYQFLNEFVIRVFYLAMSLCFLFGWISFEMLILLYIGSYALILLLLFIHSVKHQLRWDSPAKSPEKKEVLVYGLFSVLDRGASIMINNLDIIMISLLLDLEKVAIYTLAFYIGSVVLIPQKSLQLITNPVAAKSIADNNRTELHDVYKKSSLLQFLLGSVIFIAVWVNIDSIFSLLPDEFSHGKWVVLYIGLSKLFFMISGISGAMIVYSKHYKTNLYLNVVLVALTVLTNYLLIPRLGVDGAAMATALSLLIYNASKVIYIDRVFRIHPFDRNLLVSIGLMLLLAVAGQFWQLNVYNPFWTIVVKGIIFTSLSLAVAIAFSSDLRQMLVGIKKKYLG